MVLKAHKEAVNSLSGNGSAKLGTVAAAVAAANSTALESSKEIEAAMQISMRNALGMITNRSMDGPMDDFTIMKVLFVAKVLLNVGIICKVCETFTVSCCEITCGLEVCKAIKYVTWSPN